MSSPFARLIEIASLWQKSFSPSNSTSVFALESKGLVSPGG